MTVSAGGLTGGVRCDNVNIICLVVSCSCALFFTLRFLRVTLKQENDNCHILLSFIGAVHREKPHREKTKHVRRV